MRKRERERDDRKTSESFERFRREKAIKNIEKW
jgi:hypothetical protein